MNNRKDFWVAVIVLVGVLTLTGFGSYGPAVASATGNGAPSGAHYNLNIIGVPRDKTADMSGNQGHRIFVKLDGSTKIFLQQGSDFLVLDANGTDGNGARFQLPDPDPNDDLVLSYSVYARALGRPGGEGRMTTCFIDEYGDEYCSTESLILVRGKGKSTFVNVSKELLTISIDINGDGVLERVGLFDQAAYQYLWEYDNRGLKIAQLRFYPIEFNAGGQ